jgi:hypothetical protein
MAWHVATNVYFASPKSAMSPSSSINELPFYPIIKLKFMSINEPKNSIFNELNFFPSVNSKFSLEQTSKFVLLANKRIGSFSRLQILDFGDPILHSSLFDPILHPWPYSIIHPCWLL